MKKKKKKKASENRLVIFGTISIIVIMFFVYSLFSYIIEVKNLNEEQKRLENDLLLLKKEESNLKNEIEKLKDPDYLARFARENYMYSKDGEYIIKVSEKDKEDTIKIEDNSKNYLGIIIITSIALITLIFIKKIL